MNFIPVKIGRACAGLLILLLLNTATTFATDGLVAPHKTKGVFNLASAGHVAPLFISDDDYAGVKRALADLQHDIKAVTGTEPALSTGHPAGKSVVLVGTLGKSVLIDALIAQKN